MALVHLVREEPTRQVLVERLLAGPGPARGTESLAEHQARLHALPDGGEWLLEEMERSGLRGRGGAWYPTSRKWAAVAERSAGRAVVVVNGSEGEPLSAKDRTLLVHRPHLVLDGAVLAADTIGATTVVVYLARGMRAAARAVRGAIRERRRAGLPDPAIRIVATPHSYLAGESSAVVEGVMGRRPIPRMTPPYISASGVAGLPTLVQNTETLANAALIARFGATWFREAGTEAAPGTSLMTLSGAVAAPGIYEVSVGSTVAEVLEAAGGALGRPEAALVGGYFGAWHAARDLDSVVLERNLGCGVLALVPEGGCPLSEAARILAYLSGQSAGQCGPCVNGLAAIAAAMERVASSTAAPTDVVRLRRWAGLVRGRGACRHPDGAAAHLESVLDAFPGHLEAHLRGTPCPGRDVGGFPPPPQRPGWRSLLGLQ